MIGSDGGEDERLAPVTPLFGARPSRAPRGPDPVTGGEEFMPADRRVDSSPSSRHPAFAQTRPTLRAVRPAADEVDHDASELVPDPQAVRERASEALVRKLRARPLSVSEARQLLRGHDLPSSDIDDVIDEFLHRGYLDDRTLADALVTAGVERKGQGRVALSRALSQRGLPREVVDEALAALPDDDAERALEFARTKARSMTRLDPDTALRRLLGQLARRGYGGSVASQAARTALREAAGGGATSGVRFVESE